MVSVEVRTRALREVLDVTDRVNEAVQTSGVMDGAVLVYCPHTTAAVFVNEGADPDVASDVMASLERLVPRDGLYRHMEGNSAAHVSTVMVGCSALVPVTEGRLALGRWQRVFLAEFDGPRSRRLWIQVLRA